eukprot:4806926-Pyramimonas_sp.AAC.1
MFKAANTSKAGRVDRLRTRAVWGWRAPYAKRGVPRRLSGGRRRAFGNHSSSCVSSSSSCSSSSLLLRLLLS